MSESATAAENPFFVLELPVSAGNQDIVRQKQKLLGMLELGLSSAKKHTTPLGEKPRSQESVRRAAASLERPRERIMWELWASGPGTGDGEIRVPALHRALSLHFQLQKQLRDQSTFDAEEFEALGDAWDDVLFSDDFYDEVEERADELLIDDFDSIIEDFTERVRDDLVQMLEDAPACDLDEIYSDIAGEAVSQFGQRAVDLLEASCQRLVRTPMHLLKLGRAWGAFTKQYEELATSRGSYLRNTAFYTVYDPISDYVLDVHSAALYSNSAAIFRWLRDEAGALGDDENYELQDGNLNIALDAQEHESEGHYDTAPDRSGSSWGWAVAVIAIALLRFCAGGFDSGSDYDDFDYEIPNINFDYSQYDYGLPNSIDLDSLDLENKSVDELMRELDELQGASEMNRLYGLEDYEPDDGIVIDPEPALPSSDEILSGEVELLESP